MRKTPTGEYYLGEWDDIKGEFLGLEKNEEEIKLKLRTEGKIWTLIFPTDSKDAEVLEKELQDVEKGTEVGVLKTDSKEEPIIVMRM
ncbi:MAG: hypothetical protein ACOC5D_05540 [Thermoplasmatota archaeon]